MDAAEVEQLVVRRVSLALREGFALVGDGGAGRPVVVQSARHAGRTCQYLFQDGRDGDNMPVSFEIPSADEAATRFVARLGFHEANAAWALAIMRRTPSA